MRNGIIVFNFRGGGGKLIGTIGKTAMAIAARNGYRIDLALE